MMKRALAAVAVLGSLAACGPVVESVSDTTSTTIHQAPSTTTTVETSTTTTVPPTTTTTLAPADPAEVEIIASQAHEVVVEFITRLHQFGPAAGRPHLTDSDPFAGAVRSVLRFGDELDGWAAGCVDDGFCSEAWHSFKPRGKYEVLLPAGTSAIIPFGDGSYYVSGVYTPGYGPLATASYLSGFRFRVVDGQAVLEDAVAWKRQRIHGDGETAGVWISAGIWDGDAVHEVVTVENSVLEVNPVILSNSISGQFGFTFALVAVTNSTPNALDITDKFPFDVDTNYWGLHVWPTLIQPGQTKVVPVRADTQFANTVETEFLVTREASEELFELSMLVPYLSGCTQVDFDSAPEHMSDDMCLGLRSVAEAHGFVDHSTY